MEIKTLNVLQNLKKKEKTINIKVLESKTASLNVQVDIGKKWSK